MKRIAWIWLLLGLSGCASEPFSTSKLDSFVGQWTYQDAVGKYGPPASYRTLPDSTVVVTWIRQYSVASEFQQYDPKNSTYVPASPAQAKDVLRMIFNRDQILQSWNLESGDPLVNPQEVSSGKTP